MRILVALALALAVAAPMAGCLQCQPRLDLRWCRPDTPTCAPGPGDRVADWEPDLASLFPDVARLMDEVAEGKHLHADWTEGQEEAFWQFWDVPVDADGKQVFLRDDGDLFRVRVLSC
jgi:hypothetical protein